MRFEFIFLLIYGFLLFLFIPSSYAVDFYTKNATSGSGPAPPCDSGDVCLFSIFNSSTVWNSPYDFSYNGHVAGCHFADNGSAPTRVCASGLLKSVLKDDAVAGKCGMNEFGMVAPMMEGSSVLDYTLQELEQENTVK